MILREQILKDDIPAFAVGHLTQCKSDFERNKFKFYGYIKHSLGGLLPSKQSVIVQYAVFGIGDSGKAIIHGMCCKKNGRGLLSAFGLLKVVKRNIMIQSLFDNGFRLITTDLKSYKESASYHNFQWNTLESTSLDKLLIDHLKNKQTLISENNLKEIKINKLEDYYEFNNKYSLSNLSN